MKKIIITLMMLITSTICLSQVDSTYYYKSKAILDKYPNSRIKPEFLYNSAIKAYDENKVVVPCELAVAQAIIETSLGNTGVGKSKNNPFSLNSKDGYIVFDNIEDGILAYYYKLSTFYLKTKTMEQLLKNFTNHIGKRYASDRLYEIRLKKQLKKISQ